MIFTHSRFCNRKCLFFCKRFCSVNPLHSLLFLLLSMLYWGMEVDVGFKIQNLWEKKKLSNIFFPLLVFRIASHPGIKDEVIGRYVNILFFSKSKEPVILREAHKNSVQNKIIMVRGLSRKIFGFSNHQMWRIYHRSCICMWFLKLFLLGNAVIHLSETK